MNVIKLSKAILSMLHSYLTDVYYFDIFNSKIVLPRLRHNHIYKGSYLPTTLSSI